MLDFRIFKYISLLKSSRKLTKNKTFCGNFFLNPSFYLRINRWVSIWIKIILLSTSLLRVLKQDERSTTTIVICNISAYLYF